MRIPLSIGLVALLSACTSLAPRLELEPPVSASGLDGASLRGLSVSAEGVVWISGSQGALARTTDGGASWQRLVVPGADELDFRMLVALDAETAWVASAGPGDASRLFHTADGGATWTEQLANDDPAGFWDGLAFWDEDHGLMVGDPTEDPATGSWCLTVLWTEDGGATWERVPAGALPSPARSTTAAGELLEEYCFAASNRSIALGQQGRAWIGTGGGAARVLRTGDGGRTWAWADTPLGQTDAAAGVFALDAAGGFLHAVGGRYDLPDEELLTAAWSPDGGATWTTADAPPAGYRSAVAFQPPRWPSQVREAPLAVAVGTSGTSLSDPGDPRRWRTAGKVPGANAVAFEPDGRRIWAVGPGAAIWSARVVVPRDEERDEGGSLFLGRQDADDGARGASATSSLSSSARVGD